MQYPNRHYVVLLIGLLALLACALPSFGGETAEPTPTVEISQSAAEGMEAKLEEVRNTPAGEEITLTLTEEEITSYIAMNMSQDSQIENIRVRLSDGVIRVTGRVPVGPLTQDLSLLVQPTVQDQRIALQVTEAKLGSVDIPESLLDTANDEIRRTLSANNQLGTINDITVGDGQITIVAIKS